MCTKLLSQTKIIRKKHLARYVALKDICLVITSITFAVLGRFRITVPDRLPQYVKLGHEVFGKPCIASTIRFGQRARAKYKDARLERMFKDVTRRRESGR